MTFRVGSIHLTVDIVTVLGCGTVSDLATTGNLSCSSLHWSSASSSSTIFPSTVSGLWTPLLHSADLLSVFSTQPPLDPSQISPSCIFPLALCDATAQDTFLFAVTAWATLQLSWTVLLVGAQYWQIVRQMTTLEVSNLGRYGFMGGRGPSLSGQMGHRHAHGGEQGMGGDAGDALSSQNAHSHAHGGRCGAAGSFLLSITGFDRFTRGRAADGLARAKDAPNPFDSGMLGNCRDFWSNGGELGVEYERLYDVPQEGFLEAKRRREMEEGEDGLGAGKRRRGFFMGFGRGSRAGYEPVSQV
jgi:palmitoyltransferase ZDHHC13/17